MSFTEDLVDAVAEYLATNPDATQPLTWRPTGQYLASEFGIFVYAAPLARDRHSVVITPFYSSDDLTLSDSVVSIQLDFYGTRREVTRARDDAFDRLHGFEDGKIGPVDVQRVSRTSSASLGIDEAGNLRLTDNYDLAVHRPSTHRQ
jgi:hypothetical protein